MSENIKELDYVNAGKWDTSSFDPSKSVQAEMPSDNADNLCLSNRTNTIIWTGALAVAGLLNSGVLEKQPAVLSGVLAGGAAIIGYKDISSFLKGLYRKNV